MTSDDVKLIGSWTSPFVLRARIALNVKCVEYEFLEQKFGFKSDLLLKSNPVYKKVPVLIHGDRPVCESLIIVQYIDEVWASGPEILPRDPYDRAMARFSATYIDDKVYSSLRAILILLDDEDEAKRAASVEEANQVLAFLEGVLKNCSKGQKFFGGDKIGYLDIALGSFLVWIRVLEKMGDVSLIGESNTPNLFEWAQHFCAEDAVKDVLPEIERLMEFAKVLAAFYKESGNDK